MEITINRVKNKYFKSFVHLSFILISNGIFWNSAFALGTNDAPKNSTEPNLDKGALQDVAKWEPKAIQCVRSFNFESLRLAITDLIGTFPDRYSKGQEYLELLDSLEELSKVVLSPFKQDNDLAKANLVRIARELEKLRYEALLSNPLLDFDKLLLLKRRRGQLGLPVNHKCNSGIKRTGYDNEIAVLSPVHPDGGLRMLFRPPVGEFVGEIDLHFDADRLLFTMTKGKTWQIYESKVDGTGLRQVTRGEHPDVDNFDACYLPDGRIVFASTASYHAVPCWHGQQRACSLYLMKTDGSNVRQLCFDQDLDLHPAVLDSGQVIFSRWDYTGPMHMYLRPLMVMNPDGTGQRAVYGSNSYWPNALYFPRGIPGAPNKIVAIVAGYHGVPRMGELALLDLTKGWYDAEGVVQQIPGRGKPVKTVIRDRLVDKSWPKFLHPYPLSEKYFLVSSQLNSKSPWGIYLADVFDNMLPIHVQPQFDMFEPVPLRKTPRPPAVPDRVDLNRDDAIVYLHDVYAGPGLAGVPRGTVKRLRVVAYHFGYPDLAGPDKIGIGGPWEVMRIIGTVPVYEDGSTMFYVPANTPLCVQTLDKEGKAVQLMRSWFTAMPGEILSCVGCHERPNETPATRSALAARKKPAEITPWYGPARGFDFEREVQPVLDKYCVACHNGKTEKNHDLRSERYVKDYQGRQLSALASARLHPSVRKALGGTAVRYTPAYEAVVPYIRRVNIEDHVGLLVPGEYHADTSELVQMLMKGHHNVRLDGEAWDRLITWIDLNGPCHGTWGEVCPIPGGADQRRREMCRLYSGPKENPEAIPKISCPPVEPIIPRPLPETVTKVPKVTGWPFDAREARRRQVAAGTFEKMLDLGGGVMMKLVRIPTGRFVMGDPAGEADERPLTRVVIQEPFWIGAYEVTNEEYHQFDPVHDSGYFAKRYQGEDGPGLLLDDPNQPVVRVSWERALAFCRWLSRKTDMQFTLPTEAQWEYICRAGSQAPLSYGRVETDFSKYANVADKALSRRRSSTGGLGSNIVSLQGGGILCSTRFDDQTIATANVGSYHPNAWGLYDMHGNVAEWTLSTYEPYPYGDDDGRNAPRSEGRKVVRGGSFHDRPKRCRSAFRLSYPAWRKVYNVGFRVVFEPKEALAIAAGKE